MKTKQIVIIALAVVAAVGIWAAAIISLNSGDDSNKVTMPDAGDTGLMTPDEFGGMTVTPEDIPVTKDQVTGLVDGLFGTDLTDKLGGNK